MKSKEKNNEKTYFHYSGDSTFNFKKIRTSAIVSGAIFICVYVIINLIFKSNLILANNVISVLFLISWFPALQFLRLRQYEYSLLSTRNEKLGKIFFCIALFFIFTWIVTLISFLVILIGIDVYWVIPVISWTGLVFFLPYFGIVLIIK